MRHRHTGRQLSWRFLHRPGVMPPSLMAAFYLVFVETPPYTAPAWAHPSPTHGEVSCTSDSTYIIVFNIKSTPSHPRCRWHSGIQASSPAPTKLWRGEATPPTCLCTDEVHHHIICSCWVPTLGEGKTFCPVRRGGHFYRLGTNEAKATSSTCLANKAHVS